MDVNDWLLAEVERLQGVIRGLVSELDENNRLLIDNNALRAEVERLREALEAKHEKHV